MALINADELMEWCNNHYDFEVYTVGYISNLIKDIPTVDAEPVIRCTDCIKKSICSNYRYAQDEEGFCAWAERKEG